MNNGAAVYVRSAPNETGVAEQQQDLEAWCSRSGQRCEWFADHNAASDAPGPALQILLEDLRAGRFATVVAWRMERWGLDYRALLILIEQAHSMGARLLSIHDQVDLAADSGRGVVAVLEALVEIEAEQQRDRQAAGIDRAKARGRKWGGSGKGQRRTISDETKLAIHRLAAADTPKAAIARICGLSRPTVYEVLGNGEHAAYSD